MEVNKMTALNLDIPIIAITGSAGKTTSRELIASVLQTKWNILKTEDNNNLPLNTKSIAKRYNSSYQAILVELGMGKPGAGERHCKFLTPNISIITNIGTAHYGNLGNSFAATAKNKSSLIKLMNQRGILLINNDDKNSKFLETNKFPGKIITIGINTNADYRARDITFLTNGMSFFVNNDLKPYFIPVFGVHNVYNALFAFAVASHLKFTKDDIRGGFKAYKPPIKRLNFYPLKHDSILIDDTANANPQSMQTAIDVLAKVGKHKKKIVVLGDMLELGNYTTEGHEEVGRYLAKNRIDAIFTFGSASKSIQKAAIKARTPIRSTQHFEDRVKLHAALKSFIEPNSIILVKGSSSMKMDETVKFIKNEFLLQVILSDKISDSVRLSDESIKYFNLTTNKVILNFGKFTKQLTIQTDNSLEIGTIVVPRKLSNDLTLPSLPYEYYFQNNQLFLGPVIGMLILPRYKKDLTLQLPRFANYDKIRGLVYLFNQADIDTKTNTITGYYYDPATKKFATGKFPYPSAVFKRTPTLSKSFKHLQKHVGDAIFNHPYGNTNKLDFWKMFAKKLSSRQHLPLTKPYKNINDLITMLNSCSGVYLKPVSLAGGSGILYITKAKEQFLLSDEAGEQVAAKTKNELQCILNSKLVNRQYIMQQEIEFHHKNSKVDFRVYIQKDNRKKWRYSGMETKIAKTGSIISNSKNRKNIMQGETALKEIYKLSAAEIEEKIVEITSICTRVLRTMEKRGAHLGDVAVDFIIDNNKKVWLLEVQPNYAAEIKALREADEQKVLPNILPTPFEYAKALTGF
jgi:UDP-N-acetylmuramoyl-tripeptide--D-alanyl-D-alanine ligase